MHITLKLCGNSSTKITIYCHGIEGRNGLMVYSLIDNQKTSPRDTEDLCLTDKTQTSSLK